MRFSKMIVILQPNYPHYREEFFQELQKKVRGIDLFSYQEEKASIRQGFKLNSFSSKVSAWEYRGFLINSPFAMLKMKYDTLVLMLHFGHLTTWLLLLTKWLHRKKIILWGQGISVKRYLKEEKKPDWKLKWMIKLADGVWFYMDKEYLQWRTIFPKKAMVALGNSLSGVEDMIAYVPKESTAELKHKYGINQKRIFIFCARFESQYRRTDLLEQLIEKLDSQTNGFIIIGAGRYKPDFSIYKNVYDFGAVYDTSIKRELFAIADMYLQPGWVGLSIVEAMAYGKPICTFKRSKDTLQCVEYSYIEDGVNGLIFGDLDDALGKLSNISDEEIKEMGQAAKNTASKHTPALMAKNAISIIHE